jgi:hypothetical protein
MRNQHERMHACTTIYLFNIDAGLRGVETVCYFQENYRFGQIVGGLIFVRKNFITELLAMTNMSERERERETDRHTHTQREREREMELVGKVFGRQHGKSCVCVRVYVRCVCVV